MKKFKKIAAAGAAVLTVGVMAVTAFAASDYKTPAEIVAGLTGKSVESVTAEKTESGKTYGTIANDAGKLEEFKSKILENKKAVLDERVAEGQITREKADAILAAIEQNQQNCDGKGSGACGMGQGLGFGAGRGAGKGNSQCAGNACGSCLA